MIWDKEAIWKSTIRVGLFSGEMGNLGPLYSSSETSSSSEEEESESIENIDCLFFLDFLSFPFLPFVGLGVNLEVTEFSSMALVGVPIFSVVCVEVPSISAYAVVTFSASLFIPPCGPSVIGRSASSIDGGAVTLFWSSVVSPSGPVVNW